MMRIDGELVMMESTEHGCDVVFPGYNSTTEGDCSYFRIRCALTSFTLWLHDCQAGSKLFINSIAHSPSDCTDRNVSTGDVIANVSESLRHSFFAAVADHHRRVVWVFGGAHARGNTVNPNVCDVSVRLRRLEPEDLEGGLRVQFAFKSSLLRIICLHW